MSDLRTKATPARFRGLGDYWSAAGLHVPLGESAPPANWSNFVRRLTAVERATVRIEVPTVKDVPVVFGTTTEVALRLAVLDFRGQLQGMSGQAVAAYLALAFRPEHPSRYSAFGWWLLCKADADDVLRVILSTLDPLDQQRFRQMRLSDRVREMQLLTVGNPAPRRALPRPK